MTLKIRISFVENYSRVSAPHSLSFYLKIRLLLVNMKLISVFDLCRDPPFLYINLNELQKFGPYDRMQDFIL